VQVPASSLLVLRVDAGYLVLSQVETSLFELLQSGPALLEGSLGKHLP